MPQQKVRKSHNFTWVKYHTLKHKGFVNMTPDTNQFHVVCDDLIYFYEFKLKQDHHREDENIPKIPHLKNTMYNFMRCNMMMIDKKERFCLTFKTMEPDLKVFMKRFDHGFIENTDNKSREGCSGANIIS